MPSEVRPTAALIPPTATPVMILPLATATRADLFLPSDVASPAPVLALMPLMESEPLPEAFVRQMQTDLSETLNVDSQAVRWVSAARIAWGSDSNFCGEPASFHTLDGYHVLFIVGTTVYEFQTRGLEQAVLCGNPTAAAGEVLLAADPIASELTGMAQQALAAQLDLPVRRVQWVTVAAYRWRDSSLGCPLPNESYAAVEIPGYHIVVQAGDTQYAYHTDSERLYPCPDGSERMDLSVRDISAAAPPVR